ncbi:retroviral-like aspartic protease family protein [Congregibacter sp.]|uniref:retroviral-like aspartic protease family protein n=1 Tax=Congregibacter sp. TaxID=2744308 RepID=UPI003F6D7894
MTGSGGALEVSMSIDGQPVTFLLDTGAAMATINSAVFSAISDRRSVRKTREVAARMADGRTRKLDVYEIEALHLVGGCDIGPTEVIVVPGSGRNLLGLNVLSHFAPLTLSMNPPALGLSNCVRSLPHDEPLQEAIAAVAP